MQEQAPVDKTIVFGIAWYPGEKTGGVNGPDETSDMPGNVNDKTADPFMHRHVQLVSPATFATNEVDRTHDRRVYAADENFRSNHRTQQGHGDATEKL